MAARMRSSSSNVADDFVVVLLAIAAANAMFAFVSALVSIPQNHGLTTVRLDCMETVRQ